tara:strand:+ start:730 stop:1011 length:282 start_codon:yes stop_codon:yes gene_type:complete
VNEFDIHSVDYDTYYGRWFRWAHTPEDQTGTFSLVTPYNGDAWLNWEPLTEEDEKKLRGIWLEHQNAGTLKEFVAPHKLKQIEKYMNIGIQKN